MRRRLSYFTLLPVCGTAVGLAGCSGAGSDTSALNPALNLPTLPAIKLSAVSSTPPPTETPVGSATAVYSRIAQGAVSCWFGSHGPLKKGYIYHADADAPSRGGKAEIVIHIRDATEPNPRGAKAYKINIDPAGDAATVKTENLKMPEPMATAMTDDVNRWSRGDQGCAGLSTAAGWGTEKQDASPAPAPKVAAANKKSKKARPESP